MTGRPQRTSRLSTRFKMASSWTLTWLKRRYGVASATPAPDHSSNHNVVYLKTEMSTSSDSRRCSHPGRKEVFLVGKPTQRQSVHRCYRAAPRTWSSTWVVAPLKLESSASAVVVTRLPRSRNHFDSAITEWIKSHHNVWWKKTRRHAQVGQPRNDRAARSSHGTGPYWGFERDWCRSDYIQIASPLLEKGRCPRETLKESLSSPAADITEQGLVPVVGPYRCRVRPIPAGAHGSDCGLRRPRRSALSGPAYFDDPATPSRVAY